MGSKLIASALDRFVTWTHRDISAAPAVPVGYNVFLEAAFNDKILDETLGVAATPMLPSSMVRVPVQIFARSPLGTAVAVRSVDDCYPIATAERLHHLDDGSGIGRNIFDDDVILFTVHAHVAPLIAVSRVEAFVKESEDLRSSTVGFVVTESQHLLQSIRLAFLLWSRQVLVIVDQVQHRLRVRIRVVQDAGRVLSIAARSAGLLVVTLERTRQTVMDDVSYIGLVDTHPESDRGHNDFKLVLLPSLLDLATVAFRHTSMVMPGSDILIAQLLGDDLALLSGRAVDDAADSLGLSLDEIYYLLKDILLLRPHFVVQVGPIERLFQYCAAPDTKHANDVVLHLLRSCSSEGHDRDTGIVLSQVPQLQIWVGQCDRFGSKGLQSDRNYRQLCNHFGRTHIMTPSTNAVRLIDDEPRKLLPLFQSSQNALDPATHGQHLRRHVHDLGIRNRAIQFRMRNVLVRLREISGIRNGGDVALDEVACLVVDEGDQWRHNKRHTSRLPLRTDGRKLVYDSQR